MWYRRKIKPGKNVGENKKSYKSNDNEQKMRWKILLTHKQERTMKKERDKRRRAEETEEETEARLNRQREKWAESEYALNRKSKRAKTRMRESHEDTLIRKEAESLRNSPEKRQS